MAEFVLYKRKNCGKNTSNIPDQELEFIGEYTTTNEYTKEIQSCTEHDSVFIVKKYCTKIHGLKFHEKFTFKNDYRQKWSTCAFITTDERVQPANKTESKSNKIYVKTYKD